MTWRVGLLIPSSNSVMEVDFYRSLSHDTTLHSARMYAADDSALSQERMLDEFTMPAAAALGSVRPHIVVFGCESAGLLRGKEYDSDICTQVGTASGAVPISVLASVNESLRATRASRVTVVTHGTEDWNARIKAFIEAEGIEVSAMYGMGLADPDVGAVTADEIYSFVQSQVGPRVTGDALLLWGTNYQAMGALSLMKMTYDVPVVTSSLAALQAVKRTLDALRERQMPRAGAMG